MIFDIEVNNKIIKAKKGETILAALNRNGIKVPTLCRMSEFTPTGACRMCVVEIEGKPNLTPSCSYPVEEWMKIKTHSPRVIKARRTIVELLLSNHPDDCLYCERNGNCELQKLAEEMNIRERKISGNKNKNKKDHSSASIIRDPAKCILCGRCVRVCEELQNTFAIDFINRGSKIVIGTVNNKGLNFSSCIHCGQCVMVCPTGALYERSNLDIVQEALHDQETTVVVQCAPSISVSLAEEFGIRSGKDVGGVVNEALKKIGFNKVFDSTFGADLNIMEEAAELMDRLNKNQQLPMLSSCCPSWVSFVEEFFPEMIELLSTTKSPQQIMGSVIKNYYSEKEKISSEKIFSVSIMPCTAKKFEASRVEMTKKGVPDIDAVLTTREMARLIRLYGIDIQNIDSKLSDSPFALRSSAGKIIGTSGGITEAVLRTLYFKTTGEELSNYKINEARGFDGIKELKFKVGDQILGVVICSGLANAAKIMKQIKEGRNDIHFIEVMACPGGCINGGGQPIGIELNDVKVRAKTLYDIDEKESIKVSHKNPAVIDIYNNYFGEPLSDKSKKMLHTKYLKRDFL